MFIRDLAYAGRTLRKNPAFTLTAVLTIGLGIGASTAIFSVVNAVLLQPLPYGTAERLMVIWGDMRNRHVVDFPFSPPDYDDLRKEATTFDALGRFARHPAPAVREAAARVAGSLATAGTDAGRQIRR